MGRRSLEIRVAGSLIVGAVHEHLLVAVDTIVRCLTEVYVAVA
jgi:hypothetical protein